MNLNKELIMSKLIIVCGLPGSGKTVLADELSRVTGIVCLRKDSIKEKLFESLGMTTLEESKRIGKPSVDVMLHLAEQQIANGIDMIIEAPFNFSEDYGIFTEWVEKYGVRLYSVICFTSPDERKRRVETRARHGAHFDSLRTPEYFPEKEYDYAVIPGKQIRIQTDKSVSQLAEKVASHLN